MFSEKRLIHFAQSDNSSQKRSSKSDPVNQEQESPKTVQAPLTEEQIKLQEKQEKQKKVQELKLKVQKANILKDTASLALTCLNNDPDQEEIALVESLIDGTTTQNEFSKKLTLYIEKKRGIKNSNLTGIKEETALKAKKLAYIKQNSSAEQMKSKEFSESTAKLEKLGLNEQKNQKALESILAPFVKAGKITPELQETILNLHPDTPEFDKKLKLYLGDLANDKKLLQKIKLNKADYKQITEEYEKLEQKITALMQENVDAFDLRKNEYLALSRLSKSLGINIKEGALLEYLSVSPSLTKITKTAQIQKIEFKQRPSIFYSEDEKITEENKKFEEEQKNMPFGVFVTISDGTEIRTLDETALRNWVNEMQVIEVVEDLAHLEQKIGFAEYGQSLKAGSELEYIIGYNADSSPKYSQLTINRIDHKNNLIHLSQPILVAYDQSSTTRDKVTFGEFAKWFKKSNAESKMSLDEARKILTKMPLIYKNRYPDLDTQLWDFNELPIEIKPNEELTWGNNKKVKITNLDSDKIKLSNGREYSPGQFLRFVKDNEVEKSSRVPTKDEIKDKINDLLTEDSDQNSKQEDEESPKAAQIGNSLNTEDVYEKKGIFLDLWKSYTFLSLSDLAKFFQIFEEYFKRRQERGSKRRVGQVGKKIPNRLGLEYQNLEQAAENEEVEKIKGELAEQGPDLWLEKLLSVTTDTDVLKATTILLCETGNFDFEDPKIWAVFNTVYKDRVDPEEYSRTCIKMDGTQNKAGLNSLKALQNIMDVLYGKSSGVNWYNTNASAYNGEMGKLKEECDALGTTPGGLQGALHDMLVRHCRGEFVPAYRFEGFLRYIIEAGKCTAEDKFFYLLAGYVMPNPTGGYLLNKSRISSIEGALMKHLPHLDFFLGYKPFVSGTIGESRLAMKKIFDNFEFENDINWRSKNKRFNSEAIDDFIWGDVMSHASVIQRMGRIHVRGDFNMDHDDTQLIVPGLDTRAVNTIMGNTRGEVPFISPDGHANAITGYAEYLKFLTKKSTLSKSEIEARSAQGYTPPEVLIQRMLKGFFVYDSGITGRVKYGAHTTLSSELLNKAPPCIGSGKTVLEYASQVREVLREILLAYGVPNDMIYVYLDYKTGEKADKADNERHANALKQFPDHFDNLISAQGPEKMLSIVQNAVNSGRLVGYDGAEMVSKNDKKPDFEVDPRIKLLETDKLFDPAEVMKLTNQAANDNVDGKKAS